ncbi:MAG: glycosyl hydrolase [Candidatus Nitrospinota bacterium M3_3B_026]
MSAFAALALFVTAWAGCGSLEETLLVGGHEAPYHKLGMNMHPRNRTTGDIASQMADIKSLGIDMIRVTFWFDTQYMPTANSARDFSMFDEVVAAAKAQGIGIVAILAYVPDWLRGTGWKTTFVNEYVYPVVARYRNDIDYWEVWNEPDELTHGVLDGSADDYFDLLKKVSPVIRRLDPSAKILTAATTNIVGDGLSKFDWTKRLLDLGVSQYADILNVHYYSELDIELSAVGGKLVESSGMTVWVTETGRKGHAGQLAYFEREMAYIDKSLNPERIFWYVYVEGDEAGVSTPPDSTYGLLTAWGGGVTKSSLYTHLKGR